MPAAYGLSGSRRSLFRSLLLPFIFLFLHRPGMHLLHCGQASRPQRNHAGVDKCNNALVTAFYRFNGTAGSKMPTSCVPSNNCNTAATGWLNGTHPTPKDGVVNRIVCFNWNSNCCNWQVSIKVKNCGLFYVYRLMKPPPGCQLRYCVTK